MTSPSAATAATRAPATSSARALPEAPRPDAATALRTTAGDFDLHEYRLRAGDHEWGILHTGAVLSHTDEQRFLGDYATTTAKRPYGVMLWPSAIALAHELLERGESLEGRRVLELGAGTGLPGIVAASLGAHVVQSDRQLLALTVCRRNAARNGARGIEHRLADWAEWDDDERYDVVLGADVLYAASMHDRLAAIFERNLAPGGRVLLADPFRAVGLAFLEDLEERGWRVGMSRWTIGEGDDARAVGVFELARPDHAPGRAD